MIGAIDGRLGRSGGTKRAELLVVGLHVPFVVAVAAFTIPRHDLSWPTAALVVGLAVLIGGIQLRHSLAATRKERPSHWGWTLLMLALGVYVPVRWFTWDWAIAQWLLLASVLMLLPRRLGRWAASAAIVANAVVTAMYSTGFGALSDVFSVVYHVVVVVMGSLALYGSTLLVGTIDELETGRAALARVSGDRERLRISRDLHDLLGHRLSAVSLKGDLAVALLERHDDAAARAEIEGLTDIARTALHDIHAVTRDRHAVSVWSEIDAAAALLTAAGIDTVVDVDLPMLDEPIEGALAWSVREGITNVLRHSDARHCVITARHDGRSIRLELTNDGAHQVPVASSRRPVGTGLVGLTARTAAVGGTSLGCHLPDDHYQLVIEIPEPSR